MARADNWHASKAGERGGSGMGEDVRMRCRLEERGGEGETRPVLEHVNGFNASISASLARARI